ncbi:hypothetical protein EXU85_01470 [Spirosoma sp. KCTC 42546]|uniref:hypothetical protein n=1 Tax=Spirosoma sp. KCTC 42546 TaxID=2520506 RepID=UPI0011579FB8|nr:hypothetical protein [Spirosoma sp. KCTC 42546]QDK77332.1 hypothetical protein EXU85_01470 [Spirosoma sp. KCTC 42546]
MLNTLSSFFYRIASWKTLFLGVVLYMPFPAYLFKNLEAQMNALAGKIVGPIDLLLGYNPAKISQMVADYGSEGRAIYAQGELTTDIVYPLIYTFLFCTILSLLFRNRTYAPFQLVNVLPVGIWAFDLMENACIVYLLKSYPQASEAAALLCSVVTNLKWGVTLVVAIVFVYGLIRLVVGSRQRTQQASAS